MYRSWEIVLEADRIVPVLDQLYSCVGAYVIVIVVALTMPLIDHHNNNNLIYNTHIVDEISDRRHGSSVKLPRCCSM